MTVRLTPSSSHSIGSGGSEPPAAIAPRDDGLAEVVYRVAVDILDHGLYLAFGGNGMTII
jgi:hypothetical protein